jgi:predicted DNA-binding ArsR family transcriptional regulator
MNDVKIEKDFLKEIAKGVEILEKIGVISTQISVQYDVPEKEYHNICSELIRRKVILEIPKKELRLNFSGVIVTFKSQ